MESLEGYSYYDTPSGPQYIRNDASEGAANPANGDARRRNGALSTGPGVKYHPYAQGRRLVREASIAPTTDVGIMPEFEIHRCKTSGTIDPQSLRGSELFNLFGKDLVTLQQEGWPRDPGAFGLAHQEPPYNPLDAAGFGSNARESQSMPMEVDSIGVAGNMGSLSSATSGHQHQWTGSSGATQDILSSGSQAAFWPENETSGSNADSITASQLRYSSAISTTDMPQSTLYQAPHSGTLSERQLSGHSPAYVKLEGQNSAPSPIFPNFQASAMPVDTNNPDYMLNESLFEYGPFFDHYTPPKNSIQAQNAWSRQGSEATRTSLVMDRRSSLEDSEQSFPQVGLVGGYFAAADEETTKPAAPEVNSQGSIRIERLPPKRSAIVYELPALCDMTVTQLKSELKRYGLSAIGKKSDLQARLQAHLEST